MSEVASGTVVVGGSTAGAGVAVAAALGSLVLGVGYLVCKGGYQAVKSCKEAWDTHLRALEEERQKKLQELREKDERRVQKLNENLLKIAEEGKLLRHQQENEIQRKLLEERKEKFKLEQDKVTALANWKRIETLEKELANFKAVDETFIEKQLGENQKKYLKSIQEERDQLKAKFKEYSEASTNFPDSINISFSVEDISPLQKKELEGYIKDLAVVRAALATLLFANPSEVDKVREMVNKLERGIEQGKVDEASLKEQLDEVQQCLATLKEKNKRGEELWNEVQNSYFSLYEQVMTAKQDPHLQQLLKEPLEKASDVLQEVFPRISEPQANDLKYSKSTIEDCKNDFNEAVNKALMEHQNKLNQLVKDKIIESAEDMGYGRITAREDDNGIYISAKKLEPQKGPKVEFSLSPQGELTIDLSREGFKNQLECSEEFMNIQNSLREKGIYIEVTKMSKTWLSEMLKFVLDKLANMGFTRDMISIEEIHGGQRIIASNSSGENLEMTIDESTGEIKAKKASLNEEMSEIVFEDLESTEDETVFERKAEKIRI